MKADIPCYRRYRLGLGDDLRVRNIECCRGRDAHF
jgi:hypothetical protein